MDEQTDTDALVVDSGDAARVRQLLATYAPGVTIVGEPDVAPALGLERWRLENVAEAGAIWGIRTSLDRLVDLVRDWARHQHGAGWVPTIEADHLVDVTLDPHVKTAVGPPTQVDPPDPPFVAAAPDGPRIGIADARVFDHPELAGHLDADAIGGAGPFPTAASGHATFVAGTALRHAPHAVLVCRDVVRHGEPNRPWEIAQRLLAFLAVEVDVLNLSFGFITPDGPPLALTRAIARLAEHTFLVAAVGNNGDEVPYAPMYPAALPGVLSVGAAPTAAGPAPWAPQVPWLDLQAPGVDVVGPFLKGTIDAPDITGPFDTGYVRWSGSSFAAPVVSGEIARMMHDDGIDATTARDRLLHAGGGASDVAPFSYVVSGA